MVIARLEELFLRSSQGDVNGETPTISPDDYRECNYLLRTMSNILSAVTHSGWVTLLTHTLSQTEKHQDVSSEGECFFVRVASQRLTLSTDHSENKSLHSAVFDACLGIVGGQSPTGSEASSDEVKLQQTSFLLMKQLLLGPGAEEVVESGIDTFLVERLTVVLDEGGSVVLQGAIIDALLAALKVRFAPAYLPPPPPRPKNQKDRKSVV